MSNISEDERYEFNLKMLLYIFRDDVPSKRTLKDIRAAEISNLHIDELTKLTYLNTLLHYFKGGLTDYTCIMYYRDDLYRKYQDSLLRKNKIPPPMRYKQSTRSKRTVIYK